MLDYSLGAWPEMAKVGEADAIDSRRQPSFPAPPYEPRYVQQKGRVFNHLVELGSEAEGRLGHSKVKLVGQ